MVNYFCCQPWTTVPWLNSFSTMYTIDTLRDIMTKLNRQDFSSELQYLKESHQYSPPYKGRPMDIPHKNIHSQYSYPKQLSGLEDAKHQKIRLEGTASGSGQGTTPYPGMPTGGSYLT